MGDVTINLKPARSRWQVLGKEIYPGVNPYNVRVEADNWGFATCSFELPRDPFLPHPDLASFTPCVIEEDGATLFRGKVMETPARGEPQPGITVAGRGAQYALDENPIEFSWLHSDLTAWKDVRSIPGYSPAIWNPAGTVEVGSGGISFGQANDTPYGAAKAQGVFLDLGPNQRARRIEIRLSNTNIAGNSTLKFFVRGRTDTSFGDGVFGGADAGDTPPRASDVWQDAIVLMGVASGSDIITFDAQPEHSGTFAPSARLIAIFLYWLAGPGTTAQDHMVNLTKINVYGDPSFGATESGNLRSSDVVEHAVRRASVGITVPKQSARIGPYSSSDDYGSEIRAAGLSPSGPMVNWYRLNPTGGQQLQPQPGFAAINSPLAQGGTPTYTATGGPILDGNPAGSAYASFPASPAALAYLFATSSMWPDPLGLRSGWSLITWFRTTTLGNSATQLSALNNRIVSTDKAAAPPSGRFQWGVGLNNLGELMFGTIDPGGTFTVTYTGTNYADGQWHMLLVTRNRFNGSFMVGVDDNRPVAPWETSYGQASSAPGHLRQEDTTVFWATRSGGDVRYVGDLAEISWFWGEVPVQAQYHFYQAGRRAVDTTIKRTQLVLPGLATTAPRNAREIVEGVNAYHRYVTKVGVGAQMEFRPRPTVPKYALKAAAARRFSQTALTAGEEAYNRVVVSGSDGSGNPITVERTAAHQPGATFEAPPDLAFGNPDPSAPIGSVAGSYWWYQGDTGGVIVRDTTTFDSSPASLRMDPNPVSANNQDAYVYGFFNGVFRRGRRYLITFKLRPASVSFPATFIAYVGNIRQGDFARAPGTWGAAGAWTSYTIDWVPRTDYACGDPFAVGAPTEWLVDNTASFQVRAPDSEQATTTPKQFWIDTPLVRIGVNSMLDRQNDLRTRTIEHNQVLTDAIAAAVGDAFLVTRSKQQLRGTVEVGPEDIVLYKTGQPVHPGYLVEDTMEMVHIPSLLDPDTGAQGRDGLMVGVSYEPNTEHAVITVDNQADNFETLMQRHALLSG